MSNRYEVSIAVKSRETLAKIAKRVAEEAKVFPDVSEVFEEAKVSDAEDFNGTKFVRLDWHSYNGWATYGGDALLDIVREATKGEGYAYASVDDFGEDEESEGEDFEGLFYISKIVDSNLRAAKPPEVERRSA